MKRIFLIAISTLFAANSFAQTLVNVRLGYGTMQYTGDEMTARSNYYAGVGVEFPIWHRLILQTSFASTYRGGNFKYYHYGEREDKIVEQTLQLSSLIGYRMNVFIPKITVVVKGGAYASARTGTPHKRYYYFYSNQHGFDYGLATGLDIEYRHWLLGVEYQRGLQKNEFTIKQYGEGEYTLDKTFSNYTSNLYVTLGYRF